MSLPLGLFRRQSQENICMYECMYVYVCVLYLCVICVCVTIHIYSNLICVHFDICMKLTNLSLKSTTEFILTLSILILIIPFSDSKKHCSCYLQFTYQFPLYIMSFSLTPLVQAVSNSALFLAVTASLVSISFQA